MSRAARRQRPESYAGKRVAQKAARRPTARIPAPAPSEPSTTDPAGAGSSTPEPTGPRQPAPESTFRGPAATEPVMTERAAPGSAPAEPVGGGRTTLGLPARATGRGSAVRRAVHGLGLAAWLLVVLASAATLVAVLAGYVDARLADVGAVATSTAYAWGLAARTGGRPVVFSLLTLALGGAVVALDQDSVRSGAAVVTAVLTAVFAVMATVPAVRILGAVREVVVAIVIAAIGAMATLAWSPVVDLHRFEYTVLGLSLVGAFLAVYRLGAGFHGLGTRGVLTVVGGSIMLALTLGYAELLQRYGSHDLVSGLDDAVIWSRGHLGAFPRPIIAFLGVPALTWGTHMRARRRQGWWVCAFGVALTAPVAYALVDPGRTVLNVALATAYGVVIGLLLGALLIRIDLWLTGPRGRRLAETEEATAVRPEPGRTRALW